MIKLQVICKLAAWQKQKINVLRVFHALNELPAEKLIILKCLNEIYQIIKFSENENDLTMEYLTIRYTFKYMKSIKSLIRQLTTQCLSCR